MGHKTGWTWLPPTSTVAHSDWIRASLVPGESGTWKYLSDNSYYMRHGCVSDIRADLPAAPVGWARRSRNTRAPTELHAELLAPRWNCPWGTESRYQAT